MTDPTSAPPATDDLPAAAPVAPAGSITARLRAKRNDLHTNLHKDLKVPRWDEGDDNIAIWVSYRPADPTKMTSRSLIRQEAASKAKTPEEREEWVVLANADLLVAACIGIYAIENGKKLSLRDGDPHGPWTTFDPDLAYSLGFDDPLNSSAVGVCRALYATDMDLNTAAAQLVEWSGQASEEAEQALGEASGATTA